MQVVSQYESQCGGFASRHNGFVRRASVAANAGLVFFGLAMTAPAQDHAAPAPAPPVGIEQHLNNQVPLDLKFRDETGKTVSLGSYFGKKPVVLSLVYFGCRMMCTLTEYGLANTLKDLQWSLGDQYEVVTVSFDPKDIPAVAMAQRTTYEGLYGKPGAKAGWHFLVGDEPSIYSLAQAVGFQFRYMPEVDLYDHPTGIMVLTPKGRVSRYFYGVQYAPRDVQSALVDASNEKIGNPKEMEQMLQRGYSASGASTQAAPAMSSKSTAAPANHWTSATSEVGGRTQ